MNRERGTTLMELLIVITMLALLAGVTTLAVRHLPPTDHTLPMQAVADSQRASSRDAHARRLLIDDSAAAFVFPDGRVVADTVFHADLLTGRTTHAR